MSVSGGDAPPSIRLLTITRLWLFPRALHNLGGLRLTWTGPISYRLIGYGSAVFGLSFLLYGLLGVGWGGPGLTLRFVVPGLLVWWALRSAADGGRPWEFAWSWARFVRGLRAPRGGAVRVRSRCRVVR